LRAKLRLSDKITKEKPRELHSAHEKDALQPHSAAAGIAAAMCGSRLQPCPFPRHSPTVLIYKPHHHSLYSGVERIILPCIISYTAVYNELYKCV